jgi:SpoVK/Ycf46/Vps4 family AAA+-type ATPase
LDVAVDTSPSVSWSDIAGLDSAKRALYEAVILPSLRPDLFTGLRQPSKGVLLFGPPGCGKTMLAKAVATEAKCAFFSISAATLMSKYLGESEGLVKGLFSIARYVAPSVIFIDEIDALLSERSDKEHEASRRVKTEFLVQWDGMQAHAGDEPKRVLVMGATNRPDDLDGAAVRRMPQRIYIPLPDGDTRTVSLQKLLAGTKNDLSKSDFQWVVEQSEGYSQSDLKSLCQQAAMEPIRELGGQVLTTPSENVRPVLKKDFAVALKLARPSVAQDSLAYFEEWKDNFGM